MPALTNEMQQRFVSFVGFALPHECWSWGGAVLRNGYGVWGLGKKTYLAHRISYFYHHSIDPGDFYVLHSCDNRVCVNPKHLSLGTQKKNIADMFLRGRHPRLGMVGGKNPSAKLTLASVEQIRSLRKTGLTYRRLADQFGVTPQLIYGIVKNKIWRRVS